MGNPKGHTSMEVSELDSHSSSDDEYEPDEANQNESVESQNMVGSASDLSSDDEYEPDEANQNESVESQNVVGSANDLSTSTRSDGESTPVEGCLDSIPDPENGRGYDLRPPAKREAVSSGNGSPLIKIRRTESAGSSSRIGTISIPEHRKRAPADGNGQRVADQLFPRGDRTDGNNPANLVPDAPRAPAPPRSNLQGIPLWLRRLLDQYGNQPIIPVLVEIPTRPTQAPGNGNGERVVDQLFPKGDRTDGNNPANPVPAIPRVPAPPCGHGQDIPDCLRRLLNQQGNQPRTPSHAENPTRPTQDRVAPVDSGRTVDLDINSYDDGEFYSEFKDRNENEEDNDDDDDDN